jgi:hypothetical protein
MFVDLLDSMSDAMKNASRLMEVAKESNTDNPTTMMHILINDLNEAKIEAAKESEKSK